MAITAEQQHHFRAPLGFYYRWDLEADDILYVDVAAAEYYVGSVGTPYTYTGIDWRVRPEAGGTVEIATNMRPDWSSDASEWDAHGKHPSITEVTGFSEDARIGALRFVASGAGAQIHLYAAAPTPWKQG